MRRMLIAIVALGFLLACDRVLYAADRSSASCRVMVRVLPSLSVRTMETPSDAASAGRYRIVSNHQIEAISIDPLQWMEEKGASAGQRISEGNIDVFVQPLDSVPQDAPSSLTRRVKLTAMLLPIQ